MDSFEDKEFGGPLFGATSEQPVTGPDKKADGGSELSFGKDDTGSLPHWTEPPTGDIPAIPASETTSDPTDDLDVWSTFSSDAPAWKQDDDASPDEAPKDPTGELTWHDHDPTNEEPAPSSAAASSSAATSPKSSATTSSTSSADAAATTTHDAVSDAPREPARITIGTDPTGMPRRPEPTRRGGSPQRPPSSGGKAPSTDGRNLPIAVASGLILAAVFLALAMWRPAGAVAFVTVALGMAAVEYFSKVTEKGYRPAVAVGVAACVAAPLSAYWVGETALPLLISFAFIAAALGFIGADSIESGPMPNMAITMLGVVWIGVLGAFAALILRWSTFGTGTPWGTDTLVLIAIGVVANDVGAYFVGTAFGRTPIRKWISPNKSVEGLLGGTILTLLVMLVIGMQNWSDTWSSTSHLLMLGIVISAMAPLGDLTESMFKRNLDVKDFGTIIKGHGGVLDRFDGFLFTLPAVYYLMLVVEPWTAL
jgi:phosphatidate cytidylyltransferase